MFSKIRHYINRRKSRRQAKKEKKAPTYHAFLTLIDLCSKEYQEEYAEILCLQPRPSMLCGEIVPDNLNGLTYGQLDDLRSITGQDDVAFELARIVFGKPLAVANEDVNAVFGFMNFCKREIERINKLFASMKPVYTSEEKAAGVETLDFGSFGVLDWYAKRMGITNQNDVRSVAWVRIYMCMKNDHEQQLYERRLQDVYMKKH